jgi:hypothetical protein
MRQSSSLAALPHVSLIFMFPSLQQECKYREQCFGYCANIIVGWNIRIIFYLNADNIFLPEVWDYFFVIDQVLAITYELSAKLWFIGY